MAIGRITYEDKIDSSVNQQDPKYKITAQDMNEIKQVFNESAEDIEFATENLGDYKVENGIIYFKKADGSYNEQGVSLAGQSTILDGDGNVILSGYITPNDNLLTNSDFRSGIINQKGITSLDKSDGSTELGIDSWIQYGINCSVATGSITFANRTNTTHTIQQPLDIPYRVGNKVTFYASCFNITGNIYIYLTGLDTQKKKLTNGDNEFTFSLTSALQRFYIELEPNAVVSFNCMKLEIGEHFTGMPVWNEAEELLKCKSKFRKIPQSFFGYGMNNYLYIITDTEDMDKIPSVYQFNTGMDYGIVLFSDNNLTEYTLGQNVEKAFGKGYLRITLSTSSWNNWRFTGYFKDCDIFADSYEY